jgi:UDP-N-acetylmuramate--alanine ligase
MSLSPGGALIYCHDDPGARTAADRIRAQRNDLAMIPYGRTAAGPFRVSREEPGEGYTRFTLAGWPDSFTLKVPGEHNVLNAAAAIALCSRLWAAEKGESAAMDMTAARHALVSFMGSRRRSEVVGEAGGILFMDDYAHHPTAIEKTLAGIRGFYPGRRLVVDFMSHTYSRTRALLPEFAKCFNSADSVILHRIYASAREQNDGGITARELFQEVSRNHPRVIYFEEPMDAAPYLSTELKPGDLFLTMGAGDNWKLGRELLQGIRGAQ